MSDNSNKRQEVRRILLTQIESSHRIKAGDAPNLTSNNNVICSSQTYYSGLDGDMSDIAVGFYEILYSDILSGRILDGKYFNSKCFAGDTMNTGITHTRPKTKLEEKYRHCLANFWLIPMYYGRKSSKVIQSIETNDYMDKSLDVIEKEWSNLQNNIEYTPYFCKFEKFDDFKQKHYIPNEVSSSDLQSQIEFIEDRAIMISQSDKALELWEFFKTKGLIEVITLPN